MSRLALLTSAPISLALALGAHGMVSPAASAADSGKEVMLSFDAGAVARQSGSSTVETRVLTSDDGEITTTRGPRGGGDAVRLPAFDSGTPPKAAFSVVSAGEVDSLEPKSKTFMFGADFRIDAKSTGSNQDNGNNLVQRGLYGDAAQMKLEVDDGRPRCRLKGSAAAVLLTSPHQVEPDTWHRAWCRRHESRIVLKVVRLADKASWTRTVERDLGSFRFQDSTPMSAGAKLAGPARFTGGSTDQFNGSIDRVFLDIG